MVSVTCFLATTPAITTFPTAFVFPSIVHVLASQNYRVFTAACDEEDSRRALGARAKRRTLREHNGVVNTAL